jgi:hypothetical protein
MPNADPETLKRHYRLLMRLFHPDRDTSAESWGDLYAARLNQAYATLSDPDAQANYAREQRAQPQPIKPTLVRKHWPNQSAPASPSQEFLPWMQVVMPNTPEKTLAWLGFSAVLLVGWFYLNHNLQPLPDGENLETVVVEPVPRPRYFEPLEQLAPTPIVRQAELPAVTPTERVVLPPTTQATDTPLPIQVPPASLTERRAVATAEAGGAAPAHQPPFTPVYPVPRREGETVRSVGQREPKYLPIARLEEQETVSDPQVTVTRVELAPVVAKPEVAVSVPEATTVATPPVVPPIMIEDTELAALLAQFRAAYENGDARRLALMFAPHGRAQRALGRREIERSFDDQLSGREQRTLEVRYLRWQKQGGYARGEGGLLLRSEADSSGTHMRVVFEVEKKQGRLALTGFYQLD